MNAELVNKVEIPRIMIAGTGSGCGKTTISCAILKALKNNGLQVAAFKCGPDYIDPMFHAHILGRPSTNLDSFFFSENTLKALAAKNSAGTEISVIEGVMGFYDGLGFDTEKSSSYDISRITQTPVILVLNAKGSARSLLAEIQGFLSFCPENLICGVILNRCSPMTYPKLAQMIREYFADTVTPCGFLPEMQDCSLESRHLGLITAQEMKDLNRKLELLAAQAEKTINLGKIVRICKKAAELCFEPLSIPLFTERIRIAAAQDKAFCFYYHDNLDLLQEMGAEIIPFSPLNDRKLPEDIHGLYLCGGYPELYAGELSENSGMRSAVREALFHDLPYIAECGGFMYLTQSIGDKPMVGFLPGKCYNTGKLTRFGYINLKAKRDNMLCGKGEEIPAHEFHYWDCEKTGTDFTAEKLSGRRWDCVFASDNLYAGFPHFHFYANPKFAVNFYKACLQYKEKQHA